MDSAARIRGLVNYAAKQDEELVTISIVSVGKDLMGCDREVIRFSASKEQIEARVASAQTRSLDPVFAGFAPVASEDVLHLSPTTSERIAKMSKAVDGLTTEVGDGMIRVRPAADPGFSFEAIPITRAPNE